MSFFRALFALAVLASPAHLFAQTNTSSVEGGDVIAANDGRGNVATVYNQFDGRIHTIHVNRLTANGYTQWSADHQDSYYEKAYSAVMDQESSLYIAGMRQYQGQKYFLLLKYSPYGQLNWESQDTWASCTAVSAAVDIEGNVLAAGVCQTNGTYPVRILKYDPQGGVMWSQTYDGGGRNYMRSLQTDYRGDISLVVETVYGNYSDGSYATKTVVFDKNGAQVAVR